MAIREMFGGAALRVSAQDAMGPDHIGQAPAQSASIATGRLMENILGAEECLDGRSHLVVMRSGEVLAMGECTRDALRLCDCFTLRGDRLVVGNETDRPIYAAMLELPEGKSATLVSACAKTAGHCIMRMAAMDDAILLATIQRAHDDVRTELVDLVTAFGLTPSEAHVIELLVGGRSPSEIGEELHISVHTVRAHLRHCYEKLGVSTREELWQKLAPYHLK